MISLIRLSGKLRPALVKALPIGLLRKVKKSLVGQVMPSLGDDKAPFERGAHGDGINVIGSIRGEIGLGQSCRLVAREIEYCEIPFGVYNYGQFSKIRSADNSCDDIITDKLPYNINIIHVNPYELPFAYINLGRDVWDKRYNIAFWLWELETFPPEWLPALRLVDEIWTPSEFASESIRKITNKPVVTMPYALTAPTSESFDRAYFKFPPNKCLFLCMYDCSSTLERKNPLGAIRAFKLAFERTNTDARLIIKLNNPGEKDLAIIAGELSEYDNITVMSNILTKVEINSLIKCCDAVVSLHRAEGFGLVPAEAMLLGTAVIATNWSGAAEFMTPDTACLVDFDLIEIEEDAGPYKKGWRWAEPDLEQAARYMRRLSEDIDYRNQMTRRAKERITTLLSLDNAAGRIRARIGQIYREQEKG